MICIEYSHVFEIDAFVKWAKRTHKQRRYLSPTVVAAEHSTKLQRTCTYRGNPLELRWKRTAMLQVEAMHAAGTMKQKVKLEFKFSMCVFVARFFLRCFFPLPYQVSKDERLSIDWHIMNNQFWTALNAFSVLTGNRGKIIGFRIACSRLFSTVCLARFCISYLFSIFDFYFFIFFRFAIQLFLLSRQPFFHLFYLLDTFRGPTEKTMNRKVEKLIPSWKTLLFWTQC